MKKVAINRLALVLMVVVGIMRASGEQCGRQAGGALCPNNLCCSQFGWCGSTSDYCSASNKCQSQCSSGSTPTTPTTPSSSGDVGSIITSAIFEQMLKHRNDNACKGKGFYTYNAFLTAARAFPGFGNTGDTTSRKRELAAFFGQTSHETTGGWPTAPDGPYSWGYCFVREGSNTSPSGYYGRGPIQLTHDYNYDQAGKAIGANLLANPDLVATDAVISFKTAIWFWMTPQGNKPSCHNVMINNWTPSSADTSAGRVPGYGVCTNIINGGLECGRGQDSRVADRIGFYKRYCDIFGVSYGNNLDCYNQRPFA